MAGDIKPVGTNVPAGKQTSGVDLSKLREGFKPEVVEKWLDRNNPNGLNMKDPSGFVGYHRYNNGDSFAKVDTDKLGMPGLRMDRVSLGGKNFFVASGTAALLDKYLPWTSKAYLDKGVSGQATPEDLDMGRRESAKAALAAGKLEEFFSFGLGAVGDMLGGPEGRQIAEGAGRNFGKFLNDLTGGSAAGTTPPDGSKGTGTDPKKDVDPKKGPATAPKKPTDLKVPAAKVADTTAKAEKLKINDAAAKKLNERAGKPAEFDYLRTLHDRARLATRGLDGKGVDGADADIPALKMGGDGKISTAAADKDHNDKVLALRQRIYQGEYEASGLTADQAGTYTEPKDTNGTVYEEQQPKADGTEDPTKLDSDPPATTP